MEKFDEIQRLLITKYRKDIWSKFVKAISEYKMINENDKIAVCISGGKDSFTMAKCFQELKEHGNVNFKLEFVVMNPGYSEENLKKIKENANIMDIPIKIFDSNIFEVVTNSGGSPCYLCARMRRGNLYSIAKELGCNKIALGHHYDDVIETILLSLIYGGEFKTMMPKLYSTNFKGMELIRPMYFIKENDIISFCKSCNLSFINCACKFTEDNYIKNLKTSKRLEMKELIKSFRKINKNIEQNIFKSACNVNLNTLIGYHKDESKYNFLDDYDVKGVNNE